MKARIMQIYEWARMPRMTADYSQYSHKDSHHSHYLRGGFTMVEVVIMLGIIIIVSAIVLVSFPSVSANINLQKSVQQLALRFRQAQSQALAVRQVQGPFGPVVPPAVGVYISTADPTHYIVFADICPSAPNNNKIYDAGCDIIIETMSLERGVRIIELVDEAAQNQSAVSVVFTVPEASATVYNASGSIGESILVKLRTDSGNLTKAVRARTSGQVAIE
ncbi:MAG: type II secretion system protein [Candidatus Sungiibacteriota bacterium]